MPWLIANLPPAGRGGNLPDGCGSGKACATTDGNDPVPGSLNAGIANTGASGIVTMARNRAREQNAEHCRKGWLGDRLGGREDCRI